MPCHADDDKDKAKEAAIAFVREIKLLSRLSHPNIVLFMGACIHPDAQYIVTEFVARGSLYDIIHSKSQRNPQNRQSLTRSLTISQENCWPGPSISKSFCKRHKGWPICTDSRRLCCIAILRVRVRENVMRGRICWMTVWADLLLDYNFNVKLCDFGMSRVQSLSAPMSRLGTLQWVAPEVLRGETYTERLMCTGTPWSPYPILHTLVAIALLTCVPLVSVSLLGSWWRWKRHMRASTNWRWPMELPGEVFDSSFLKQHHPRSSIYPTCNASTSQCSSFFFFYK